MWFTISRDVTRLVRGAKDKIITRRGSGTLTSFARSKTFSGLRTQKSFMGDMDSRLFTPCLHVIFH